MKRTIEITASYTGTISTGQWENLKPFFALKETLEYDPDTQELPDEKIIERQAELQKINEDAFKRQDAIAYQEKIANTYKNIRFYDVGDKKYPSVTSIINMDKDFHIPPDELNQFSSRGTLIHKQVEIFLTTGEWKVPKDIEECSFEYLSVVNGNLGLDFEDVDFRAFYESYPFKVIECEKTVVNNDHQYAGRVDIIGIIEEENKAKWDKVEGVKYGVPTIFDVKTATTIDKIHGFTQGAAYARAEGIEQICLIPLTKENKCGFAKALTTTNIERYFNLFLNKRKLFRDRYGI